MSKLESAAKIETPTLLKGQVWKVEEQQLEITRVGKLLVEFILTRQKAAAPVPSHTRAKKQLMSIKSVLDILKGRKGVLIN